jgi:hypothetical protein
VDTLSPLVHSPSSLARSPVNTSVKPSYHLGHQRIGLFNGGTRLVDEACLDRLPSGAISGELLVRK